MSLLVESYRSKCQIKWETMLNTSFDWKFIWPLSKEIPCSNKEKQFQWKIIQNAIFSEHRLQLMNMCNGHCHLCKRDIEDIRHLFFLCPVSYEIVKMFEGKINSILDKQLQITMWLESQDVIIGLIHERIRKSKVFSQSDK